MSDKPEGEVLSQDEIDALLDGVDSGEVETEVEPVETAPVGDVQPFDFSSLERIVRGRLATLELVNERIARDLRLGLGNVLGRLPGVSAEAVETSRFGDFQQLLPTPSSVHLVALEPLKGTGLVAMTSRLVFALVDSFFGGGRVDPELPVREFTAAEQRVIERALELVLHCMREAWAPVYTISPQPTGHETNPQFLNLMAPSEVVVVSSFSIELEAGGGDLFMALPYAMLEPIRELLDAGVQGDVTVRDEQWGAKLRERLNAAPVEVTGTFANAEITVRELLALAPGDVITLEVPDVVTGGVDDVPVFQARYGTHRGRWALQVSRMVSAATEDGLAAMGSATESNHG